MCILSSNCGKLISAETVTQYKVILLPVYSAIHRAGIPVWWAYFLTLFFFLSPFGIMEQNLKRLNWQNALTSELVKETISQAVVSASSIGGKGAVCHARYFISVLIVTPFSEQLIFYT